MKVLLLGCNRLPTTYLDVGAHGLGRHVYDFIKELRSRQCNLTVMLHKNSKLEWDDVEFIPFCSENEAQCVKQVKSVYDTGLDLIFDNTHLKLFSSVFSDKSVPIINFIHDEESNFIPYNSIVGNEYQRIKYPGAKLYKTGINLDHFNVFEEKKDYLSYAGKIHPFKGYDIAAEIGKACNVEVRFAGPIYDANAFSHIDKSKYLGEIKDHKLLCEHIGRSFGILAPSRHDAGGIVIIEAAAMGTPCITLDTCGSQHNVKHGVTGYVVSNAFEAKSYVEKLKELCPKTIRKFCEDNWDLSKNFDKIFNQCKKVVSGERW